MIGRLRGQLVSRQPPFLLLDVNGFVMEGSGENIFIVRDGVLYTPDLTSALDGITRKTVIALAAELGIAEKVWFTGWISYADLLRYQPATGF